MLKRSQQSLATVNTPTPKKTPKTNNSKDENREIQTRFFFNPKSPPSPSSNKKQHGNKSIQNNIT